MQNYTELMKITKISERRMIIFIVVDEFKNIRNSALL